MTDGKTPIKAPESKKHTCHVKRTRSNVQMHVCPPRGSTVHSRSERVNASEVPHRPRETHAHQRFPTPATRIHRPVSFRARQYIRSPTPATRNARPPSLRDTRPDANPHGTELTMHPREHRAGTQQTKRTRVQPPDPADSKRKPFATHSGKRLDAKGALAARH